MGRATRAPRCAARLKTLPGPCCCCARSRGGQRADYAMRALDRTTLIRTTLIEEKSVPPMPLCMSHRGVSHLCCRIWRALGAHSG